MGYTLTYRSCGAVSAGQEAAVRQAAEAFNRGREWVLVFTTDQRDSSLVCGMAPSADPGSGLSPGEGLRWPGPYVAKCLLDALCHISRDCGVDWEIMTTYGLRPVGVIRNGVCIDDPEAHAEAMRNLGERLRHAADG